MLNSPIQAAGEAVAANYQRSSAAVRRRRAAMPGDVPLEAYSICQLADIINTYDRLAELIDHVTDERPFVVDSVAHPGFVDLTPAGAPLSDFVDWLRKQHMRMIDELRERQPADDIDVEERARILCGNLTDYGEIAAIAIEAALALATPRPKVV